MTAPINYKSTDVYPVNNNTRWAGDSTNPLGRASGESCVEADASRVSIATVKTPAIPESPAKQDSDVAYNLKVTSTGEVEWEVDAASSEPVQADWNETDSSKLSYIQHKPTIPVIAENTMVFKSFAEGVLTVTVDDTDYTLQVTNGALVWAAVE